MCSLGRLDESLNDGPDMNCGPRWGDTNLVIMLPLNVPNTNVVRYLSPSIDFNWLSITKQFEIIRLIWLACVCLHEPSINHRLNSYVSYFSV